MTSNWNWYMALRRQEAGRGRRAELSAWRPAVQFSRRLLRVGQPLVLQALDRPSLPQGSDKAVQVGFEDGIALGHADADALGVDAFVVVGQEAEVGVLLVQAKQDE